MKSVGGVDGGLSRPAEQKFLEEIKLRKFWLKVENYAKEICY